VRALAIRPSLNGLARMGYIRLVDTPLAGKRLLVVDDDADLAGVVAEAAARLGASVEIVPGGRAALAALHHRRPDVAILDLPFPDLRGSVILEALRRSRVPAFAVSGVYRGARAAEELRRLGAADLLEKPFDVERLLDAAARALGLAAPPPERARDEVTGSVPLTRGDALTAALAFGLEALPSSAGPAGDGPLEAFATRVAEPEGTAPAPAPADAAPPASEGELARTSVARLLVALHVAQATGALTLRRGAVRKIVVVANGAPVYAASNVAAERFGALCVRRGIIAEDALARLRREAPQARTADLLLSRGHLTPAQRAELVAGQIRAIAWSTFEWRDGAYAIQLGLPPPGTVPVALPPGAFVLRGIQRTAALPRLHAELPPELHLAPRPDPAVELYALPLTDAEARLVAVADGTKRVSDLAALSDLPERDTLALLDALRVLRVLDTADRVLASSRRTGFM
jgi:CheY-like chemotaxis protein